ncbi:MAG: PEP-CTERM sorting domain-containing protein [Candidatus Dadabacteria bacterium]|nr:PEP-CTERM sorting domain-containing protein [Candidatus Dadabacteria bacterium]
MKVKKLIKIVWLAGFLALGVLISLNSPAHALTLDFWNVTELNNSGDYVEVTFGDDGFGHTTLSVQWFEDDTNDLTTTALGIDKFGFTGSVSVLTCPTGWNCNIGPNHMDGFGFFEQYETDPGGTDGITSPIVFVLNGIVSESGFEAAAHVRYNGNCSGFVSNRTTTSINDDPNCVAAPEPSSLLLLGSGLIAMGLWGRKRLRKT